MLKAVYFFLGLAVVAYIASYIVSNKASTTENNDNQVVCTADAMQCPDGSFVGRVGPSCEFAACPSVEDENQNEEVSVSDNDKANLITANVSVGEVISSPLTLSGEARGQWFFEGSFPIFLTNWDGLIIYEGFASANGEWMTTEFVPFSTSITFTSPYQPGDPDFMKNGTLILKKDNPSDLPELDDALEIPIRFAE